MRMPLCAFTASSDNAHTSTDNAQETGIGVDELVKRGYLDKCKQGPLYWLDTADSQPCIGTGGIAAWQLTAHGARPGLTRALPDACSCRCAVLLLLLHCALRLWLLSEGALNAMPCMHTALAPPSLRAPLPPSHPPRTTNAPGGRQASCSTLGCRTRRSTPSSWPWTRWQPSSHASTKTLGRTRWRPSARIVTVFAVCIGRVVCNYCCMAESKSGSLGMRILCCRCLVGRDTREGAVGY